MRTHQSNRRFAAARVLLAASSLLGMGAIAAVHSAGASVSHVSDPYANETINVGVPSLPALGGDPFGDSESPASYTNSAIYDRLTTINPQGVTSPSLAVSWKHTSPTTWTFALRHGVKFSDGETFDSTAVVTALSYAALNPLGVATSAAKIFAPIVTAVSAQGKWNVVITTKTPVVILPQLLDELYIPAPNVLNTIGENGLKTHPVGTGPFVVTSYGSTEVMMRAFQRSWHAPKVGFLNITALPTSASRLQALQSGQINLAISLDPGQIGQANTATTRANVSSVAQVMSVELINQAAHTTSPSETALQSPLVRQALNYAVNKTVLGSALLDGRGHAESQGAIPGVLGYNPLVKAYPYDPTKAKALLAQAGYPNGFPLTLDVIVGSFPNDGPIYQAMAADFDAVGVNTTLNSVPFATWLGFYNSGNWGTAGGFGLSWNSLFTNDITTSMNNFTCLRVPTTFCDQATATELQSAEVVNNLAARGKRLEAVAKMMYDDPPAVWLTSQIDINGLSKNLEGFANLRRSYPYQVMYLKK